MRLNSLAFRLFATAAAWVALVLPLAGFLIASLHRQEAEDSFNRRVQLLLTVVQADSLDHAGVEPGAPRDVGEPLFEILHSGWYWQISPIDGGGGRTLVSTSLASSNLTLPSEMKAKVDARGIRWADVKGPLGERLRVAEQHQRFADAATTREYSFAVAGRVGELDRAVTSFRYRLATALALTGIGLVAVTLFQVRFGLLPLRQIERGLAAIRSGDAAKLEGDLPAEIEPLQHELNALIQSNQDIIERARTQVGNLAHALKTPLAVITNEAREDKGPFAQKVAEQARTMHQQITYYLDRARVAARAGTIGRVTEVRPAMEPLVRALTRIHRDKEIAIELECPDQIRFQGEKQDLEEMVGVLLDNACKWGSRTVKVAVVPAAEGAPRSGPRLMRITIDDDGPGLTADQRAKLGKRGVRLDETKPGTGLGLSIVIDFAQSYRGRFELAQSPLGGVRAQLDLPQA